MPKRFQVLVVGVGVDAQQLRTTNDVATERKLAQDQVALRREITVNGVQKQCSKLIQTSLDTENRLIVILCTINKYFIKD